MNWSALVAGVSLACALVVTGFVVRREISGPTAVLRPRGLGDYRPTAVPNWDELAAGGHRMGPPNARFVIVEFADFQCPACRQFTLKTVASLRKHYPDDVAVVYRHWPLPYHPFAHAAARASECAAAQGRFERMHDRMFILQDSIGLKPFVEFASEAGVPDTLQFVSCIEESDSSAALADARAAVALGGRGTPTVLVNGNLLEGVPDSAGLHAVFLSHMKEQRK
ncbi:MAG: thioredoxin domain-containing protein [Gemmatimonadales bacterium]|nr:thioredoxin domain-containing protein [Gemmatimonadales bacterium]